MFGLCAFQSLKLKLRCRLAWVSVLGQPHPLELHGHNNSCVMIGPEDQPSLVADVAG